MKLSNYDQYKYDYATYWDNRQYENSAESITLSTLLAKSSGERFIDVGGSFGRLLPIYARKYREVVIIDYSLETLKKYAPEIRSKFDNVTLIAANAYKLPFKEGTFDGGLMVRVLHHIEKPDTYLREISRVMNRHGVYLQEFANKIHIKAYIKATIKGDKVRLDQTPYQQPSQGNLEGSEQETVFLNFHPTFIKKLLLQHGFDISGKGSSSFLRSGFLKRRVPFGLMIFLEKVCQRVFGRSNIAPSIVYRAIKNNGSDRDLSQTSTLDQLCCPQCHGDLGKVSGVQFDCPQCNLQFRSQNGIFDMRVD